MRGYNKVILIGNLTRDPELRYTQKGMAIAKFGLAVNRSWRDAESGEIKEEVTFVDVDAFGKQAETIGQYMKKGSPLFVEGRLKLDTWDDKQTNQKRSKMGVVVENFQFLGGGPTREGGGGGQPGGGEFESATPRQRYSSPSKPATAANAPAPDADSMPPDDDDVPF